MTIEELEAKLETVSRERDEAKKEAAESYKEMIMLYNDHSSVELEKQIRIEELTRERVKFQALAALGEGYRRERDEARETIVALTTAMAEKDLEIATLTAALDERDLEAERSLEQYDRLTRERDEARAEVERLREESATQADISRSTIARMKQQLREARAEVQRLTDERDELLVRVADQGAELRATRDAYGTAYRRGAEAMRDACVATIHEGGLVWTRESAERALREIGILEEP